MPCRQSTDSCTFVAFHNRRFCGTGAHDWVGSCSRCQSVSARFGTWTRWTSSWGAAGSSGSGWPGRRGRSPGCSSPPSGLGPPCISRGALIWSTRSFWSTRLGTPQRWASRTVSACTWSIATTKTTQWSPGRSGPKWALFLDFHVECASWFSREVVFLCFLSCN